MPSTLLPLVATWRLSSTSCPNLETAGLTWTSLLKTVSTTQRRRATLRWHDTSLRREGSTPVSGTGYESRHVYFLHAFFDLFGIIYFICTQNDADCFHLACANGKLKVVQELVNRHNVDPHVVNEVCVSC